MSNELDEFTAQLNNASGAQPSGMNASGAPAMNAQPAQGQPQMTPQQMEAMKKAQAMKAKLDARPLTLDELKGKVDMKWFGHSGFKLSFKDAEDVHRNIYIDIWVDNKNCPEEEKAEPPNDADLALVTHGQMDHSMHAPFLMMAGKREKRQIVCTSEVGLYFEQFRKLPPQLFAKMQPGGTKDFGYCKVTMVSAVHPSTCQGPQGMQITGGMGVGFVVSIPHHNISIYHAGDTNVFGDMKIIDDLYRPDIALLPIGDYLGMGPKEAAYAVKNYLPTPKTIVPMHFESFPVLTGTVEEFEKQCSEMGVEGKTIVHPKNFFGGKAIVE